MQRNSSHFILISGISEFFWRSSRLISVKILLTIFIIPLLACGCSDRSQSDDLIAISGDVSDIVSDSVSADDSDAGSEGISGSIYVYVCGEVKYPGVYELSSGDRIIHAVEAAGGFTDDAAISYLNQAEELSDGEKLSIPSKKEAKILEAASASGNDASNNEDTAQASSSPSGSGSSKSAGTDDGKININTASASELEALSGIGTSRAEAIIKYREETGGFSSTEDIKNVSGIGDGIYAQIKDSITV